MPPTRGFGCALLSLSLLPYSNSVVADLSALAECGMRRHEAWLERLDRYSTLAQQVVGDQLYADGAR